MTVAATGATTGDSPIAAEENVADVDGAAQVIAKERGAAEARKREGSYRRAVAAKDRMREVLVAAGVTRLSPLVDAETSAGKIKLPSLSVQGATVIADLMRKGMERDFAVADALRAALDRIGVAISDISVIDRRLALGEVPVADADHLAVLLGAPDFYDDGDEVDFNHWPIAQEVVARLDAMVKEVTGDLLSTDFHPECRRCGTEATVRLGELDIDAAEKLVTVVAAGAER